MPSKKTLRGKTCRLVHGKKETCCINPKRGHWCWSKKTKRNISRKMKKDCCKNKKLSLKGGKKNKSSTLKRYGGLNFQYGEKTISTTQGKFFPGIKSEPTDDRNARKEAEEIRDKILEITRQVKPNNNPTIPQRIDKIYHLLSENIDSFTIPQKEMLKKRLDKEIYESSQRIHKARYKGENIASGDNYTVQILPKVLNGQEVEAQNYEDPDDTEDQDTNTIKGTVRYVQPPEQQQ